MFYRFYYYNLGEQGSKIMLGPIETMFYITLAAIGTIIFFIVYLLIPKPAGKS